MAENNPPRFLNAGSHDAEGDRQLLYEIFGRSSCIFASGEFAVTEKGTPDMSVNVAAGKAFIDGSENAAQGGYFVSADTVTNIVISNGDGSNDRIDIIVAQVEDAEYSGSTNAWSLAVVEGTPAASPSAPTAPDNSITLAEVLVEQNESTSILNADITDKRSANGLLDVSMGGSIGVSSIAAGSITNTEVSASANIAYSKLDLTGDIVNADISTSAAINPSKMTSGTFGGSGNYAVPARFGATRGTQPTFYDRNNTDSGFGWSADGTCAIYSDGQTVASFDDGTITFSNSDVPSHGGVTTNMKKLYIHQTTGQIYKSNVTGA